jgi:hypothetical protein
VLLKDRSDLKKTLSCSRRKRWQAPGMATAAASRQSACTWRSRLPAAAAYACSSTARAAQFPLFASICIRAAESATSIATTMGTGLLTQTQSTASAAVASRVPDLQALTWCAEVKDLIPIWPIGHKAVGICVHSTGTSAQSCPRLQRVCYVSCTVQCVV